MCAWGRVVGPADQPFSLSASSPVHLSVPPRGCKRVPELGKEVSGRRLGSDLTAVTISPPISTAVRSDRLILQLRLEPAAGPGLRMNQLSLGLGFYFIISLQLPRRQQKREREGETPSWQISFPARGAVGAGRGGMVFRRLTAVSYKGRSFYKGTSFSIGSCAVMKSKGELSQGWSRESPCGRKALGLPGLVWSHGGAVQALKGSTGRSQAGETSVPRKRWDQHKTQRMCLFLHPQHI